MDSRLFQSLTPIYDESSFIVGPCNHDVFEWMSSWPNKIDTFSTLLTGPFKSGKKHLSHIWKNKVNAQVIKKIPFVSESLLPINKHTVFYLPVKLTLIQEENLFHAFNSFKAEGGHILFVSNHSVNEMNLQLKDLKSRLLTSQHVHINDPDEMFLKQLYAKLFYACGVKVSLDVIDFLSMRMERTFSCAYNTVMILEKKALSLNRGITIPFIKECLNI